MKSVMTRSRRVNSKSRWERMLERVTDKLSRCFWRNVRSVARRSIRIAAWVWAGADFGSRVRASIRALASLSLLLCVSIAVADGWSPAAPLIYPRSFHAATGLPDGKVLVTGGYSAGSVVTNSEVYDPATNTWSAAARIPVPRYQHTATLLTGGKVLVVGGQTGTLVLFSAELYDPATDKWSEAGSLKTRRFQHTATLLPDGKVLVTGGETGPNRWSNFFPVSSAELYDPATNTWSPAGHLTTGRSLHSAALLANGNVLVMGGQDFMNTILASAELYDQSSNSWAPVASMLSARAAMTATTLNNGMVLVAGGFAYGSALASTEIYDPAANAWSAAGHMTAAREDHTATLLADGGVLAVGGDIATSCCVGTAERYDASSSMWLSAGNLLVPRSVHTASLVPDGRVLVAGGEDGSFNALGSVEMYSGPAGAAGVVPQSGYWWNPAEVGRGYLLEYNGTKIFMATFLYDASGRSIWYGAGPAPISGATFSAPLSSFSGGQTLTGAFRQASQGTSPGTISITFSDATHGSMTWPGGTIPIERYEFATNGLNSPPTSTQPQTGWWWNPNEGGRGYSVEVQANSAFIATYMYDGSGNPVWYASGPAPLSNSNTYQGSWTSYSGGQTLTGSYHSPTGTANAGSLTLQFTSSTAGTLTLPDGRQIPIQRFGF